MSPSGAKELIFFTRKQLKYGQLNKINTLSVDDRYVQIDTVYRTASDKVPMDYIFS